MSTEQQVPENPAAQEASRSRSMETSAAKVDSTSVEIPANQAEQTQSEQQAPGQDGPSQPSYHYGILKRHMRFDPLSVVFALLIFAGGIIGYVTKQSTASLVSGTIFALLLAIATYVEGARKNPYPLLLTLVALAAMMIYRFSQSGSFMPSGFVALLTLIMLARHSYLFYLRRQVARS